LENGEEKAKEATPPSIPSLMVKNFTSIIHPTRFSSLSLHNSHLGLLKYCFLINVYVLILKFVCSEFRLCEMGLACYRVHSEDMETQFW
jgi:hypothetical protein